MAKNRNSKRFLYIIAGVFTGVLLIASLILFYFIYPSPAVVAAVFWVLQTAAIIAALILSFVISTHYHILNKTNGGDNTVGYYFKRICFTVVSLVVMHIAISEAVGMFVNGILGGTRLQMIASGRFFMQGFIVKAPLFLIYLALVYNMLSQQGYRDANRKLFNAPLKLLIVAVAFMLMLPSAALSSMHETQYVANMGGVNIQAVFSANQDVYMRDQATDYVSRNPDFNIILTAFTVLLAGAAQIALAMFAYIRGKQTFLKKRLNPNEVETDEAF